MNRPADPTPAAADKRVGILELHGRGCTWGIPSAKVLGVLSEHEWLGEPPLDAARMLGVGEPEDGAQRRVLVVAGAHGERAILVHGKMAYQEVAEQDVLELPPGFQGPGGQRACWQIVLFEGYARLLLLEPHRLPYDIPEAIQHPGAAIGLTSQSR